MKKILVTLLSLLMAVSAAFIPTAAYAASSNLDSYYIENPSGKAWDNIPYTQFNKTNSSTGHNINGFFYNYYDTENYCFYVRLAYTYTGEGKLRSNSINYYFNITNSANNYEFYLTSGGKKEYCTVTCTSAKDDDVIGKMINVTGYTEGETFQGNQVIATVNIGVELLNSQDKKLDTTVSFWPHLNDKFKILDADLLLPNEPVTTTKATTTKAATTTTTKVTTTKATTTKASTTAKTTTAKTTTTNTATTAKATTTKAAASSIPTVQVQSTTANTVNTVTVYTGSSSGSSGSSGGSGSSSSGEISTVAVATPLMADVVTTTAASGGLLKVNVADSGNSSGASSSGKSGSSGSLNTVSVAGSSSSGSSGGSSGGSSSKNSSGGSSSGFSGSAAGSSSGEYAAADVYANTAYEGNGASTDYAAVSESKNTMSAPAKIMLWVAVVVIVIGIALIIIAAVFRQRAKKEAENNF